jgi:acetaldehyde dehydrogenase (acetylating)
VDTGIAEEVKREFVNEGGYFLNRAEIEAVTNVVVSPQRLPSPAVVGRPATFIAEKAGISVPAGTRVLIAELAGVGRDYPLSIEKLCPVLSYYVVQDWREGCERCKEILRYGGMGHTMSVHSRNDQIILEFGLKKPAYRIVVNTPTTHGSIGLTTGLDPAMTLGCGGWGGNITSDNISPKHLINVKRVAYETTPAKSRDDRASAAASTGGRAATVSASARTNSGITPELLGERIDQFLASRGIVTPSAPVSGSAGMPKGRPAEFVCEEDVRQALRSGQKILLNSRSIVTPAARDLGEEKRIFVEAR